jgi:hypothetical protein
MTEKVASLAHGELDVLILQALARKLIEKGLLSPDDVKALLFEAATRVDLVGSEQTPQAAHIIVQEDLLPAFLGSWLLVSGSGGSVALATAVPSLRWWRFYDDDTGPAFWQDSPRRRAADRGRDSAAETCPRGVPGAPDTATMTPQYRKNLPEVGEFDGHTA